MNEETIEILVWPDMCWRYAEDVDDVDLLIHAGRSDDFVRVQAQVPDGLEDISEWIDEHLVELTAAAVTDRIQRRQNEAAERQ